MTTKRKSKPAAPPRISKRGRINEGRPPRFATVEELKREIEIYFRTQDNRIKTVDIDENGNAKQAIVPAPYTIEGLVYSLDVEPETLWAWEHDAEHGGRGPQFSNAVKGAKKRIRAQWAERVQESKNPAGTIFYGKAALGYRDVQQVELSGKDGGAIQEECHLKFADVTFDPTKGE